MNTSTAFIDKEPDLSEEQAKEARLNEICSNFRRDLASLINKYSFENSSNTPDFIIADYLFRCLQTFNFTVKRRDNWYSDRSS